MTSLDILKPNKTKKYVKGLNSLPAVCLRNSFCTKAGRFFLIYFFLLLGILYLCVQDFKRNIAVCLQYDLFCFLTANYLLGFAYYVK